MKMNDVAWRQWGGVKWALTVRCVLDADGVGVRRVLQNQLLQQKERPLVIHVLPHLCAHPHKPFSLPQKRLLAAALQRSVGEGGGEPSSEAWRPRANPSHRGPRCSCVPKPKARQPCVWSVVRPVGPRGARAMHLC